MCGKLRKSMYGTRGAAQNWGGEYSKFMVESGFRKGTSSPCVFWHPDREIRCVVHCDDFTVLSWETQLDWFWGMIQKRFGFKHRGRLGPGRNDKKQIRILNRIVDWTDAGILHEGDQMHVEICIKQVGRRNRQEK